MHFFAAALADDRSSLDDGSDQIEPFAAFSRSGQAIDARGPQRTNWIPRAVAVAVGELLDRRLVRSVMAGCPCRMVFIQRTAVENAFVNRTGRDKNEAADAGLPRRVDQAQAAEDISLRELNHIAF